MQFNFSTNKSAYFFWFLRWLLVLLLFYVLGDYLEGPPTRFVIRSWPFIVACVSLSLLTAQFLHQVHRLALVKLTVPALAIPAAFIYCAQLYYNGGKNEVYVQAISFFFVLMCLIGVVYLYSLFVILPKKSRDKDVLADEESEPRYEITLYELDSEEQRGAIKIHMHGGIDLPEEIVVDGFSRDILIDLNDYWEAMLDNDLDDYSTNVTTYETIIKFGETMQLVNKYQLFLKLY